MTQQQVVELMSSSNNASEWNANADRVKATCGGYPAFWYGAVIATGPAINIQTLTAPDPSKAA